MRLPINILFSSLARTQGERAIVVVLSGMGSDGTLGLQAVKTMGGLILVQQPETAQFDAMPIAAIASGCADIIAPPSALPGHILDYIARLPPRTHDQPAAAHEDTTHADHQGIPLREIFKLLQEHTRHDFSHYKPNTLNRGSSVAWPSMPSRRRPCMQDSCGKTSRKSDLLFRELLIGVTSFFRDAPVWRQLAEVTLPDLLARRAPGHQLRAWVVGCSTGEEAYSLAMIFAELTERQPQFAGCSMQIFASDLSPDAIATARRGQYPSSISEPVSAERLAKFFTSH